MQGEVHAGASSVRYAVSGPMGASALDFGRGATGQGYAQLERTVAAIVAIFLGYDLLTAVIASSGEIRYCSSLSGLSVITMVR